MNRRQRLTTVVTSNGVPCWHVVIMSGSKAPVTSTWESNGCARRSHPCRLAETAPELSTSTTQPLSTPSVTVPWSVVVVPAGNDVATIEPLDADDADDAEADVDEVALCCGCPDDPQATTNRARVSVAAPSDTPRRARARYDCFVPTSPIRAVWPPRRRGATGTTRLLATLITGSG
jgi:hypothetical protein